MSGELVKVAAKLAAKTWGGRWVAAPTSQPDKDSVSDRNVKEAA